MTDMMLFYLLFVNMCKLIIYNFIFFKYVIFNYVYMTFLHLLLLHRWLEWIKASKRQDLESKSPNCAYQNCTLYHLHFKEKWLRKTTVIRLHPDAIPTIFFGSAFDRE